MTDRCETCRYFNPSVRTGFNAGACRRDPPTIVGTTTGVETLWPIVPKDAWCGEYQPRPAEVVAAPAVIPVELRRPGRPRKAQP